MRKIYDPIRQLWVAATPEEVVRQTWIQRMIGELQFPKEFLAVEKELKTLPHLARHQKLPSRRIDLLCFMKMKNELKPLLLIECKGASLTEEALKQAIDYNYYVEAPYIAIANPSEIRFLSRRQCEILRLPSYPELIEAIDG